MVQYNVNVCNMQCIGIWPEQYRKIKEATRENNQILKHRKQTIIQYTVGNANSKK